MNRGSVLICQYVRRPLKYGVDETYNVSADFGQNGWDTKH